MRVGVIGSDCGSVHARHMHSHSRLFIYGEHHLPQTLPNPRIDLDQALSSALMNLSGQRVRIEREDYDSIERHVHVHFRQLLRRPLLEADVTARNDRGSSPLSSPLV